MKICVVGLGYVGLPLAIQFAQSNVTVVGLDTDESKVDLIQKGQSYIKHIASETITRMVEAKKLCASTDFQNVARADAVIICVPSPLNKNREPDISYILETGKMVAPHLSKGTLVALESTTYTSTTDENLREFLTRFWNGGWRRFPPRFLSRAGRSCTRTVLLRRFRKLSAALLPPASRGDCVYSTAIKQQCQYHSCRVAEAAKLLENIFRSVNIALVNELKMSTLHGIDIGKLSCCETKPFGFMPFIQPGVVDTASRLTLLSNLESANSGRTLVSSNWPRN